MVEFLLTHVPTLSVTKERSQILLGKIRTHDFRTINSRCAGYLLVDHSGDEVLYLKYKSERAPRPLTDDPAALTDVLTNEPPVLTELTNDPDVLFKEKSERT